MQHRAANAGGHKMHRASLLTPAKRLFTGGGGVWCTGAFISSERTLNSI